MITNIRATFMGLAGNRVCCKNLARSVSVRRVILYSDRHACDLLVVIWLFVFARSLFLLRSFCCSAALQGTSTRSSARSPASRSYAHQVLC
jgi:hypothetical protein